MRQIHNQRGEVPTILLGLLLLALIGGVGYYAYQQHLTQQAYDANATVSTGKAIAQPVATPTIVQNDPDGAAAVAAGKQADNQNIDAAQIDSLDTQ